MESRAGARKYTCVEGLKEPNGETERNIWEKKSEEQKADRGGKNL